MAATASPAGKCPKRRAPSRAPTIPNCQFGWAQCYQRRRIVSDGMLTPCFASTGFRGAMGYAEG